MKRNILILNINVSVYRVNCQSMILVDFFCHITVPKNICLTLTLFSVTLILHLCVHTSPKCGLCFTLIFATICFDCTAPFKIYLLPFEMNELIYRILKKTNFGDLSHLLVTSTLFLLQTFLDFNFFHYSVAKILTVFMMILEI